MKRIYRIPPEGSFSLLPNQTSHHPRRNALCSAGLFLCLLAALAFLWHPFIPTRLQAAEGDEDSPWIYIKSQTKLSSVDWLVRKKMVNGVEMANGLTKAQDARRRDVGIGEAIDLEVIAKKPGGLGFEEDVVWNIVAGDAYFGLGNGDVHEGATLTKKQCRGH